MCNLLGEYIRRKRKAAKLSLRDFGVLCDLSHSYIDNIEKGIDFRTGKKICLTNDTLLKIAKALNVNENILFALSLDKTSSKFDFFYDYIEREEMKVKARLALKNNNLPIEQQIENVDTLFKAHYSRSVEANKFDTNHVEYNEYIAMLLWQEHWKKTLSPEVYSFFYNKYGTKKGISNGKTIYNEEFFEDNENEYKKEDTVKRIFLRLRADSDFLEAVQVLESLNDEHLQLAVSMMRAFKKD